MTTTSLKQYMRFAKDSKGNITDIMFDYRNKEVKAFFEDLMDTLTIIERKDERVTSLKDLRQEIMSERNVTKK